MNKFSVGTRLVRTDQGGELAKRKDFRNLIETFDYVVKPTGAKSPSQNGASKIMNNKLAVKTRTLLYGSGLLATFWSTALLHTVYLHNCLVHSATKQTPYESWYGRQPDASQLKTFSSQVCVKQTGHR